jgi:type IV secretory pathway TrbD component
MLDAKISIPVALATSAVVVGVYAHFLPSNADARSIVPNVHLEGAERTALLTAVGVAAAISLVAKDPVPFWFGGLLAVALSWSHRYANYVDPSTGKLSELPTAADDARRYQAEAIG